MRIIATLLINLIESIISSVLSLKCPRMTMFERLKRNAYYDVFAKGKPHHNVNNN